MERVGSEFESDQSRDASDQVLLLKGFPDDVGATAGFQQSDCFRIQKGRDKQGWDSDVIVT